MKKILCCLAFIAGIVSLQASSTSNDLLFTKVAEHAAENPTNENITVLFAYTKRAALDIGGGAKEIKNQVDYGMKLLNDALKNSNIGYGVTAVAEYVEVDMMDEVSDARGLLTELGKVEGKYNKVHQYRQMKQADIVCLIFNGSDAKGIANLFGDLMVCHIYTFDGSYIFAHEFGHNLGAVHSNKEGEPYQRTYHHKFNDQWYGTVSNNGRIAIPYFSENRTINYTFKYQDANDEYKWKTKTEKVKLGDDKYNNAATMRNQAKKTVLFGEALKPVKNAPGAYNARLVNPSTEPIPAGGRAAFKFIDFTFNDNTKLATFKYEATQIYCSKYRKYDIKAIDPTGKEIAGFGQYGGLNPGNPRTVDVSFKKYTYKPTGYVAELTPGCKIQLWFTEIEGDAPKLLKEIPYGDPITFSSANDPTLVQSFKVDESNSNIMITYKPIKENVPYKIQYVTPKGGKGNSSGALSYKKTDLLSESPWQEAPEKGTKYELLINDKVVKTYIVGQGQVGTTATATTTSTTTITEPTTKPTTTPKTTSDSDIVTSFTVNDKGHITIIYKEITKDIPYKLEYVLPEGGKGDTEHFLWKSNTKQVLDDVFSAKPAGTKYYLYINGKVVKTYVVGQGQVASNTVTEPTKKPLTITGKLQNISIGKSARQSSDWDNTYAGAEKAVDGNTDGNFKIGNTANTITHTRDEDSPWWEVDLGSVHEIGYIYIWNRLDCCWERLQDFTVAVSEEPFGDEIKGSSDKVSVYGPFSPWYRGRKSNKVDINARGRYVRITLVKGDKPRPLSITEVQILGKPAK